MTVKLFDNSSILEFDATVVSCEKNKKEYDIILDKSAFFPEGGGQPGDNGYIENARISDTKEIKTDEGLVVLHKSDKPIEVGSNVHCTIDEETRLRRMQNHSGEHLLTGIIHGKYGYTNVGFHIGSADTTLDLDGTLTDQQLAECEFIANKAISEDKAITITYPDSETLKNLDYRSKLDLTKNVRIVTIDGYDVCACCAPHVSSTGKIGMVKVISHESYKGGTRIHMLCGLDALDDYNKKLANVKAISSALSAKPEKIADAVIKLQEEVASLRKFANEINQQKANEIIESLKKEGEFKNKCVFVKSLDRKQLADIANAGAELAGGIFAIVCGEGENYNYVISSKSVNLRDKSKEINSALGGKGGGSNTMIQGSFNASRQAISSFLENFGG